MSLKNPVTPPGIDPGAAQLVAQRLNQYATPGPHMEYEEPELVRTLKTVDRELATYRSDLLEVQEVLLGKGVAE